MMQQTKATSKLGQRYGPALDQAVLAHKDAPIETGFQNLPGGIPSNVGVFRLAELEFKTHMVDSNNKGAKKADGTDAHATQEMYLSGIGVVQEPKTWKTDQGEMPCKGLQTRCMSGGLRYIPLYDTKNSSGKVTTQEEHVHEVLNLFKLLAGGENGGQQFVDQFVAAHPTNIGDALEAMAAALMSAKPYAHFSTRKGSVQTTGQYAGKDPMVFEEWFSSFDYTPPASGSMRDNTAPPATAPHVNGQQTAADPPVPTGGTNRVATAATAPPVKTDAAVAEMLAAAKGDTSDPKTVAAQAQLRAWTLAAGVAESAVDDADDWEAVVKLLQTAEAAPSVAVEEAGAVVVEEPAPAAAGWQKGQMCRINVSVVDKATKTKKVRQVHCEVQAAHPDGTCDLLNMDDRKTVYGKVSPKLMEQVVS